MKLCKDAVNQGAPLIVILVVNVIEGARRLVIIIKPIKAN